jgi:hypothetical protein
MPMQWESSVRTDNEVWLTTHSVQDWPCIIGAGMRSASTPRASFSPYRVNGILATSDCE